MAAGRTSWTQRLTGLRISKKVSKDEDKLTTWVTSDVITEQRTLDMTCLSHNSMPPPQNQLLPNNLFTNILLIVHEICRRCNCLSRIQGCMIRHSEVPEGPWMAVHAAAQPGWTSETPNKQPVQLVTSYMTWGLQSDLTWSWLHPADLWHTNISGI